MDDLASRTPEELITLIVGLQATVRKQSELIASLRREPDEMEDNRQHRVTVEFLPARFPR